MRESVDKYDVSEVLTKLGRLQEGVMGGGWGWSRWLVGAGAGSTFK